MATPLTLAKISIKDNYSNWNTYLNLIYPIGSYYISNKSDSPAAKFGGIWNSISGRFLYAATSIGNGNYDATTHTHGLSNGYAKIALESSIGVEGKTVTTYTTNRHYFDSGWTGSSAGSNWQTGRGVSLGGNSNSATNGLPARRNCFMWYRTA